MHMAMAAIPCFLEFSIEGSIDRGGDACQIPKESRMLASWRTSMEKIKDLHERLKKLKDSPNRPDGQSTPQIPGEPQNPVNDEATPSKPDLPQSNTGH
jgi:hypothetical protein